MMPDGGAILFSHLEGINSKWGSPETNLEKTVGRTLHNCARPV
jgi:hypothetical protein